MSRYQEEQTQTTVTKYLTADEFMIDRGFDGFPVIRIQEVEVEEVNGERVAVRPTRKLEQKINASMANVQFDAINENNGNVVATLTLAQFNHVIYGLYRKIVEQYDS